MASPSPSRLAWELLDGGSQRLAFNGPQRFVLTQCYDPKQDDTEWELEYIPTRHGRITLRYFPTLTAALAECESLATENEHEGTRST